MTGGSGGRPAMRRGGGLAAWLISAAIASVCLLGSGAALAGFSDGMVRIGILNDRSGIYRDLGGEGSAVAARMAVEDMAGSLDGMAVEIVVGDHHNDPVEGLRVLRAWMAEPGGLDAVVDVPNSAVALAVQQVARETGLVHLNLSAGAPDLTGRACAQTGIHWVFDTFALANGTGRALVEDGGRSWFFVTADYVFGHRLEADTAAAVLAAGGRVVGALRHPFANPDFTHYLTAAAAAGADIIAFADAGADLVRAVQTAADMDLRRQGVRVAALLTFLSEIDALGLQTAQGLVLTTGWYWDLDDATRAFARRFAERMDGRLPTMTHAGAYSAVRHYLTAVAALGDDSGPRVAQEMRARRVDDMFAHHGWIRPDGRLVHDMFLAQVKTPEESQGRGDYYRILRRIPGELAFRPMAAGECPLVRTPER